MSDVVIRVENLCKEYRLGKIGHGTLYQDLQSGWAKFRGKEDPNAKIDLINNDRMNKTNDKFCALNGISFDIQRGEIVGIVGRNGAGKSTLLKIISRVTAPTKGTIKIKGRVASMLEVGTGFHPELSGRENIFLNGAILGMHKGEIEQKFDEIVKFSEIDKFIDTPVKRYSSGMYVRLAFAVAAHLDPEILLVDEVLAVGDAAFRKKCLGKMGDVAKGGKTVVFVSHNMAAIQKICQRTLWIDGGHLMADGESTEITTQYLNTLNKELSKIKKTAGLTVEHVILHNGDGNECTNFLPGDNLCVEIHYYAKERILQPKFFVTVLSSHGPCFTANMVLDGKYPEYIEGNGVLMCKFWSIPLLPQFYTIKMKISLYDGTINLFGPYEVASFHVTGDIDIYGFEGEFRHKLMPQNPPLIIPYQWNYHNGKTTNLSLKNKKKIVIHLNKGESE